MKSGHNAAIMCKPCPLRVSLHFLLWGPGKPNNLTLQVVIYKVHSQELHNWATKRKSYNVLCRFVILPWAGFIAPLGPTCSLWPTSWTHLLGTVQETVLCQDLESARPLFWKATGFIDLSLCKTPISAFGRRHVSRMDISLLIYLVPGKWLENLVKWNL